MTICFLALFHRATDTRLFDQEAKFLVRAGYPVTIIGIHDKYEEIDKVKIIPVKKPSVNLIGLINAIFNLYNLAINTYSEVYQFHDPELLVLGLILKLQGYKVIYDVHEDYEQKLLTRLKGPRILKRFISKLWWLVEKILSYSFDQIVVADSHIQQKFPRTKVVVVPNVPSEEFWSSSVRTRGNDDEFRLIYVGTITRDRGILETICALDFVKHDHVTFHIIGGTEDQELIKLFKSCPNVIWHGRVKWKELGNELSNADAGVVLLQPVPAYLYYPGENIVKLWEYLSVGLPVLISNFPKLEKLCQELGFGLAVDPTDPRKIAEAIDYLIDHPEERKCFSENGKHIVRTEYNAENKMKVLVRAYEDLLGKKETLNA